MKKSILAIALLSLSLSACIPSVDIDPNLPQKIQYDGYWLTYFTSAIDPTIEYDDLIYTCIEGFAYLRVDTSIVIDTCNPTLRVRFVADKTI